MSETVTEIKKSVADAKDHLANERTFLAWIRTSIGLMAFGFVIEKFSIFLKQLGYFIGKPGVPLPNNISPALQSHSAILGVFLLGFGSLICLMAFIKYKKVEVQITNGDYQPTILLDMMLSLTVFCIGLFLTIYWVHSL